MTEQEAILILNAIPGLGNIRIRNLISHFSSAGNILKLSEDRWESEQILARNVFQKILEFPKDKFLDDEYNLVLKHKAQIVSCLEENFPKNLQEIPDAPVVLYYKGNLAANDEAAVAVVGSRMASFYGLSLAEKFARRFAELGITVVSGMARGIDTAAHRGCLQASGRTLAILGCGLTHIYPRENKGLMESIEKQGAVISEFPMATPARAYNFPRRNRIISGLSLGVLVVEASLKSGALVTSRCALEQGREVFAIPGQIDHPTAQGPHRLIKEGAKLVNGVEDVLEELRLPLESFLFKLTDVKKKLSPENREEIGNLSPEESRVYHHLTLQPVYIDELAKQMQSTPLDMMKVLLQLELKQYVKQLPGKYFVRKTVFSVPGT